MKKRFLVKLVVFFAALLVMQTASQAEELTEKQTNMIRSVISDQLSAFSDNDAPRAYSYAAPVVKLRFPTADSFMNMVEKGYGAIYRSSSYDFGRSQMNDNREIFQELILTDQQGKTWQSIYILQQLKSGDWKIKGVHIRPSTSSIL